jgi:Na+/melibiose symporter-like transporter
MTAIAEAAPDAATPTDLPVSDRTRILVYLAVLGLIVGYGAPYHGLIWIPISYFLKNRLHLHASEVAIFRLIACIPLYFGFLWGFARDIWNPFGRGDRGFMMLFGALGAVGYGVCALVPATRETLMVAVAVLTAIYMFVPSAANGLGATIARQHTMTGQMSSVMNIVISVAGLLPYALGGQLSNFLERGEAESAARTLFLIGAAAMAIIALFAAWRPKVVYDNVQAEQREFHPLQDFVRLFKHWPIYPALAIWFLWNFAPGSSTPLQYYLQDTLHAPDSVYGNWNAIFGLGFIPTFLLYAALCRRVNLRTLLFWGTVVAVPQMVPLLFAKTVVLSYVAAALAGVLGGVCSAAYLDLLIRSCPRGLEGTIIMAAGALYYLVSFAGDVLGTALYDHFHSFTVCVIAITVVYALIVPTLWLVPRRLTETPDGVAPEGGYDAA